MTYLIMYLFMYLILALFVLHTTDEERYATNW